MLVSCTGRRVGFCRWFVLHVADVVVELYFLESMDVRDMDMFYYNDELSDQVPTAQVVR